MKNIKKSCLIIFLLLILATILTTNILMNSKSNTIVIESKKYTINNHIDIEEKLEIAIKKIKFDRLVNEKEDNTVEQIEDVVVEENKVEEDIAYYAPVSNEEIANAIVNFSIQYVGYPYVSGGVSLTNGTDCSGFVQTVFSNFGYNLPRGTIEQSYVGYDVDINNILPGDIVLYGYNGISTHSAIYIGNYNIIHAATPEQGIIISNYNIMPIVSIRRVIY